MARGILGQAEAPLVASVATLYTVPAGTEVTSLAMHVCETSDAAITLDVWVADDGSAIADEYLLYNDYSVSAKGTVTLGLPPMSTSGGRVYIAASVAGALTCTLYGTERTL